MGQREGGGGPRHRSDPPVLSCLEHQVRGRPASSPDSFSTQGLLPSSPAASPELAALSSACEHAILKFHSGFHKGNAM